MLETTYLLLDASQIAVEKEFMSLKFRMIT